MNDHVPADAANLGIYRYDVATAVGTQTASNGTKWIKLEGGGDCGERWLPITKDGRTLLHPVGQAEADAVRTLLPPPPAVQYWLDGGDASTADGGDPPEAALAANWLVETVAHAHLSPALIKPAGRALLAQSAFTCNLGAFNVYSTDGNHRFLGTVWKILMEQLDAKLTALGEAARAFNEHANVATELGSAAVAACSTRHPSYPPASRARQDEAMPAVAARFDFVNGWKDRPEQVYIHTLCLIGLALDPLFAAELDSITSDIGYPNRQPAVVQRQQSDDSVNEMTDPIPSTELHAALTKSYGRMAGKMVASEDHRYVKPKPRPAMNIDIVRRLAVAQDTAAARALIAGVSARFGGFSYLKCLTDLSATDLTAAATRYHMLPVMLTVEFAPVGWTVGKMFADVDVQAAWAARRTARPGSVSSEQWRRDHDAAVQVLLGVDPTTPLKQHCEVQLVLKALAEIRLAMHELYKLKRADSGALLHADVVKPEEEEEDEQDLVEAARMGRIVTVERLLAGVCGGGGDQDEGEEGEERRCIRRRYVNRRRAGANGATALYMAAEQGHLPVVLALLGADADPALANTTNVVTPLYIAAQSGHVDVLALLLEANADPSTATTDDGATPVFATASKGHAEVLALLLEANADPSSARTDDGATPVFVAAQKGHTDVLALLLKANADPSVARTDDGATPAYIAAQDGHEDVLALLLEANADPSAATTDDGATPVFIAAQDGHVGVLTLLLEANADPSAARTDAGQTPVFAAAQNGYTEVLALLLEANADPSAAMTTNGATPVWIAAQDGHLDVVNMLLEAGVPTSDVLIGGDFDGQSIISVAAECGQLDVVRAIVATGARPGTALTSNGATDLWLACYNGHTDVVRYLVSQDDVDINRARFDPAGENLTPDIPGPGTTPLQITELEGHTECATLMRASGAV
jgi:ankyrin repeat protein